MKCRGLFVLVLILLLPAARSRADEITFNNGDRVSGKITKVADGRITIEGTVFGTVTVDAAAVKSIDQPTTAPSTSPTTAPTTAPSSRPATRPATQPATRPTTRPATQSTTGP